MRVGIVDADLIGRDKHRFPNLACEKLSGYWKEKGAVVELLTDYSWFYNDKVNLFDDKSETNIYDKIFISKVFTDTWVPDEIDELKHKVRTIDDRIQIGGTGFYFDKAPNLPGEIEHHMPDYHLYDDWINKEIQKAQKDAESCGKVFNANKFKVQFKEYTDYSIGFVTRGCFRKCPFCVNQKFDHVFLHSPLEEFYDPTRKKLCLLDDNFMGFAQWKPLLQDILDTGKSFKFKQGLDERLLTEEKCEMFFNANYDGDYTFAFDNIADYDLIHKKLRMIQKYNTKHKSVKFYVLVGFESTDATDIENAFRRIELLFQYGCLPYIMRYMNKNDTPWKHSEYRSLYVTIARWCNQPSIVKKMSFREFCIANQTLHKTKGYCSSMQSLLDFECNYPEIAKRYFDLKFDDYKLKKSEEI